MLVSYKLVFYKKLRRLNSHCCLNTFCSMEIHFQYEIYNYMYQELCSNKELLFDSSMEK